MSQIKRYPIAKPLRQMAALVGLDEVRLLRRAGLSPDVLDHEIRGVTAPEFYALWQAAFEEADNPLLPLELGRAYAQGPYLPAILAFSCSPNTEIGLTRLALFKPLVAPISIRVDRAGDTVQITIGSSEPDTPMPACAAAFELVYFLECTRKFTAHHVVPVHVGLPESPTPQDALAEYFGVPVAIADAARITLSLVDAHRPLLSENAAFWATMEVDLQRQMAERDRPVTVSGRVHDTLVELLPSGEATVDAVCRRLAMSRRSLQRRLQAEGETFQSLLESTRAELSLKYLSSDDLSVEEISLLLAYRDPNSFYRAFHSWTGMTPAQARGRRPQ